MTFSVTLDGVALDPDRVTIDGIDGLSASADGTGSQGGVIFDDPDKSLTTRGWMHVQALEDDCTRPVLFNGYITDRTISRGTYKDGGARIIDSTISDSNALLHMRIIFAPSGKRPAESFADRIDWLLASNLLGLVNDVGWINTVAIDCDEADYRGQYADDVLNDMTGPLNWIFFAQWDPVTESVGLFVDAPTVYIGTSDISISNVLSDVEADADCYEPFLDASQAIDGSVAYSRCRYVYATGVVVRDNATTASTFFSDSSLDPYNTRGFQVENTRVGKLTTAQTFADRLLAKASTENETVTVTIILPSSKIGLVEAGMRINCRFTHLDGWESFKYGRISSRTFRMLEGRTDLYLATLILNARASSSGGGGGAPPPDDFPHPPPVPTSIVQQVSGQSSATLTMPNPIGVGNTLVAALAQRGAPIQWNYAAEGWTVCPDGESAGAGGDDIAIVYKGPTDGTESQSITALAPMVLTSGTFYEVAGTVTPDQHSQNTGTGFTLSSGSITAQAGFIVGIGAQGVGGGYDSAAPGVSYAIGSGWTEDHDNQTLGGGHPTVVTGHRFDAGTYAFTATNELPSGDAWISQVVSFVSDAAAADPPSPGQWVYNELVTLTAGAGTTQFPFADGSLHVRYDIIDQTPAIVSYDGATRDFQMPSQPPLGTQVFVDYQGR